MKFIQELPENEDFVQMAEFKGNLFIATNKKIYCYDSTRGQFIPVDLVNLEDK